MIPLFILSHLSAFFRSRYNLALEILALRQQLGVLKRKRPHPRLRIQDRIFWTLFRRLWSEMEPRSGNCRRELLDHLMDHYGIVKLRRPLADLANEHQYTNLPGIPISSGYHQPCRLALSPILPELPRC
jgi:hypothetical protein